MPRGQYASNRRYSQNLQFQLCFLNANCIKARGTDPSDHRYREAFGPPMDTKRRPRRGESGTAQLVNTISSMFTLTPRIQAGKRARNELPDIDGHLPQTYFAWLSTFSLRHAPYRSFDTIPRSVIAVRLSAVRRVNSAPSRDIDASTNSVFFRTPPSASTQVVLSPSSRVIDPS